MGIVMGVSIPSIQTSEGTRNVPYYDQVKVLTVCTGHTGPDVVVGKVYSDQQCSQLTQQDAEKAASGVLKVSPHLIYHPYVLASAISFSYNVGVGTYDKSSVAREFNSGNFVQGCNDLMKYTYTNGKFNKGLEFRRQREKDLCLSTITPKGLADVPVSKSINSTT
jgi:lysozyme